jgi:ComF family protein
LANKAFVPVPLHPKKTFIRGYNQSLCLTEGIISSYNAKLDKSLVVRKVHSASQTKKSRFQRWDNVRGIFNIHPRVKNYKHIALVDDMITTGSTLEAIIQALKNENPDLSISVITLAIAL